MANRNDPRTYARDLRRIADALERIAEHLAPAEPVRDRRPATLGTATYRRPNDTPEAWAEVEAQSKPPRAVNAKILRDE